MYKAASAAFFISLFNARAMQSLQSPKTPSQLLWLGTWSLGGEGFGPTDLGESLATIQMALEMGIKWFDTAGFYAHGRSEELLAKALGRARKQVAISSKGGLVWHGRRVFHDGSPSGLEKALLQSLRRLRTDYLDLFSLHWPDPHVPLEESVGALERFKERGLILEWGVCNLSPVQLSSLFQARAGRYHQVQFNLLHRDRAVLEAGRSSGCTNTVYSPLAQGLLGAPRLSKGMAVLGKKDARRRNPLFRDPAVLDWARRFHALCKDSGVSPVAAAYSWVLLDGRVDRVISGAKTRSQLGEVLRAAEAVGRLCGERDSSRRAKALAALLSPELIKHMETPPCSTWPLTRQPGKD